VVAAAVGAVLDTRMMSLVLDGSGLPPYWGGGLRGGRWETRGARGLLLRRVGWAPGVRVSGRVSSRLGRLRGTITVDGPSGLDGALRFRPGRAVAGRIGGRPVRLAERYARGAVQPAAAGS
jgi:hypothetical protein